MGIQSRQDPGRQVAPARESFGFAQVAFLAFSLLAGASAPSPSPSVFPSPTVSPSVLPSAQPSPSAAPLSASDIKSLLKEYQRAQVAEMAALEHRQNFEMKELEASQKFRLREWQKRTDEARAKFFREHTKGVERRQHVQQIRASREALLKLLKEELAQRKNEHEVRRQSVRDDQKSKHKEFRQALEKGDRPPDWLWPRMGS